MTQKDSRTKKEKKGGRGAVQMVGRTDGRTDVRTDIRTYRRNGPAYVLRGAGFASFGAYAPSLPHYIHPSTEMGRRVPMTTNAFASVVLLLHPLVGRSVGPVFICYNCINISEISFAYCSRLVFFLQMNFILNN